MVNLNILSPQTLTNEEIQLMALIMHSLISIPEMNPELTENKCALSNFDISYTKTEYLEDNQKRVTESSVTREQFVSVVQKGLDTILQLIADTGEIIEQPFMPVTLIDMPILQHAAVYLNEAPDFLPTNENGQLMFNLRGKLAEFMEKYN